MARVYFTRINKSFRWIYAGSSLFIFMKENWSRMGNFNPSCYKTLLNFSFSGISLLKNYYIEDFGNRLIHNHRHRSGIKKSVYHWKLILYNNIKTFLRVRCGINLQCHRTEQTQKAGSDSNQWSWKSFQNIYSLNSLIIQILNLWSMWFSCSLEIKTSVHWLCC